MNVATVDHLVIAATTLAQGCDFVESGIANERRGDAGVAATVEETMQTRAT